MIDFGRFKDVTSLVVEKMEGGYYHPNMLKDGRVKDNRYKNSGETMFGIDRKTGGTINDTIAGQNFWGAIDNANAKNTWQWNYKGGNLKPKLMDYTAQMMFTQYNKLANAYLSKQSQDIINSDNRLLFNFIYATWNGSGWFKKFATDFNNKVASGERNTDNLTQFVIDLRTKEGLQKGSSPNSLIKQGGQKIASFIDELKTSTIKGVKFTTQSIQENPIISTILISTLIVAGWYLVRTIRNKQ